MRVFQFHLQKVLDLKEKEKEQAEWAFGKSIQRKNEEEWKLSQLTEHHDEMTMKLQEVQMQTCSAAQLISITQYQQSVAKSIQNQQRTLHGCEQDVERCQSRLTERMKESQLWQRLREKSLHQFLDDQKQREQKELDEIGTQLYLRRSY
ncbi:flagellar export protein FliJ [Brevibacillus sp. M2.1A]|uniref:flagellar export protein FliJ n=1 Tax=Brevibacillus TaxID=55080 RepID=UPI00156B9164|nr:MULTISPECIES: flagellar export protein FliJ [Brevibacillus]MCE0449506.1 flagellar export protein FliJ [Brevibacillus sp. AF8]MCM3141459.1 flagellar export protein FliJ [Brevibacillus sp. MER 51]MBH0331249.1 flagellar export protein FliJ [Brevibacillus brevis]MBY0088786.1 flagellar export protein FliJ [Brevibacillus brevis]MCC8436910.1 flagellar export protein FliJ [Brevibacillus sp. M2.1A]